MKIRIYKNDDQPVSNWSGGKTRELAIFPEDSAYLDRDFIWRLSTASSDREESSFSRLEGFDRILMVIEGDVVLAHGQERSAKLGPMEQDTFDGGIKTRCFGKLEKDYNLIMAKGCSGSLEVIDLSEKAVEIKDEEKDGKYRSYGIYCIEGYAVISSGDRSEMIQPGTQAVLDMEPGEKQVPALMGEGRCILARVSFGEEAEGTEEVKDAAEGNADGAPEAKQEKGGSFFSEYPTCFRLFLRSNKWSKIMRREGADSIYYDRKLSRALDKIERRYVTPLIWAAGCIVCFIPAMVTDGLVLSVILALVFTCVHIFLIAPFIYWSMLPKPISSHMKTTDQLDAFEKMHHAEEISKDPHFERLMSKYSSDDDNYFADENSVLYKLVKKK